MKFYFPWQRERKTVCNWYWKRKWWEELSAHCPGQVDGTLFSLFLQIFCNQNIIVSFLKLILILSQIWNEFSNNWVNISFSLKNEYCVTCFVFYFMTIRVDECFEVSPFLLSTRKKKSNGKINFKSTLPWLHILKKFKKLIILFIFHILPDIHFLFSIHMYRILYTYNYIFFILLSFFL